MATMQIAEYAANGIELMSHKYDSFLDIECI